ncbi:MAG TPA: helicase-related protein [Candidatus Tumulicola sp.]|jgi:superfamily II DNA or RNA helicase
MKALERFAPGTLVRARGREWITLEHDADVLRVRPLSGSGADETVIYLPLELDPVLPATFPAPVATQKASHDAAMLLRDALLLSLRRGAGPFRSFGHLSIEPRAYQLVPLLMALKLETVRLLIADDVGVGKTIEAGLIARELLDRGEISRIAVLCPPHLVEQWVEELERAFHIRALPVTAASAARLERDLPPTEGIFEAHSFTVVSLDYIKSDKRRGEFLRACPEFVIVDEAHTCAAVGKGRHQRYELLRELSKSIDRHLVMLTATPHSGDEAAFYRLLGLLDPEFEQLPSAREDRRQELREKLSRHFVQRRRPDIDEWKEGRLFPRRETAELTYSLSGPWRTFFDNVLDYCASIVERGAPDEHRRRLNFWGTLALMRCASSSPAAAAETLRNRQSNEVTVDEGALEDEVFDGTPDALPNDDVQSPIIMPDPLLSGLIKQAEQLKGQGGDPKLKLLTAHLESLIAEGFNPVVFCRYIPTAHYLKRQLDGRFTGVAVEVVTGEFTSAERELRVEALGTAERRLLVATDCLSEGVNLQEYFDAVVHYDLSWNPTRHEQREGRVDRFGQESPTVRASLIYGEDNPVDGAVLKVILRKAESIRRELGVSVPLPDDGHRLTQALMRAVLLRGDRRQKQFSFDYDRVEAREIELVWRNVAETAKRNRTVFAQGRLRPDDVMPEWRRTLTAIGGDDDVRRFASRALARLGAGLESMKRGYKVPLLGLPEDIQERLEAEGLTGTLRVDFVYPARGCMSVLRSHPLIAVLADALLERSLASGPDLESSDPAMLGRTGCWIAPVTTRTVIALLRARHQLTTTGLRPSSLLVEEATAVAWQGTDEGLSYSDYALSLLALPVVGDPPIVVQEREITRALLSLTGRAAEINAFAERRAQELLSDHRRVREAAQARGSYSVKSLLPPDIIGVYILLPNIQ